MCGATSVRSAERLHNSAFTGSFRPIERSSFPPKILQSLADQPPLDQRVPGSSPGAPTIAETKKPHAGAFFISARAGVTELALPGCSSEPPRRRPAGPLVILDLIGGTSCTVRTEARHALAALLCGKG